MYPKNVDKCVRIRDTKNRKEKTLMSNKNSHTKYSEEFKKTIVTLYQSGKTYADIRKEYGVSSSALSNWIRKYSQVQVDEDTVLTAQQIKALQRRNAELEEENLILKNHCNLHATLKQRLKAVQALSKQHRISILCRVLNVNRSTYYKSVNRQPSSRSWKISSPENPGTLCQNG